MASNFDKAETKGWLKAHMDEMVAKADEMTSPEDLLIDTWIESHDYDCDNVDPNGKEAWLYAIMDEIYAED